MNPILHQHPKQTPPRVSIHTNQPPTTTPKKTTNPKKTHRRGEERSLGHLSETIRESLSDNICLRLHDTSIYSDFDICSNSSVPQCNQQRNHHPESQSTPILANAPPNST